MGGCVCFMRDFIEVVDTGQVIVDSNFCIREIVKDGFR